MSENQKSPAKQKTDPAEPPVSVIAMPQSDPPTQQQQPEFGGRKGPEATRYGDWEMNGKCVDF